MKTSTRICSRCKQKLKFKNTSAGYYANCPNCYEDLYKFETIKIKDIKFKQLRGQNDRYRITRQNNS